MNPVLLHIYGPLSIHAYGLCIAVGGLISFVLLSKDSKMNSLASAQTMTTLLQIILCSGFLGGRIVDMLSQPDPLQDPLFLFRFWEPGLSILGAIIGTTVSLVAYLSYKKIPLMPLLDRIALYAPLAQSFGRLGCFFAGCCYGLPATHWFSVTYVHPNNLAPLHCALHPSQLYSSLLLLCIFLFLYFVAQHKTKKTGLLLFYYLFLTGIERFLIDFIRWDRISITEPYLLSFFSLHQWIAISICSFAILGIFFISKRRL